MRDGKPQNATFHLYLHPAAAETKYVGTTEVGFLKGAVDPKAARPSEATVKPSSSPVNVSTTGIIQSPGTYDVVIAFTATSTAGGPALPIQLRVPITVR